MNTFKYTCTTCGKTHEGSPSFSFEAPFYYYGDKLKEENRKLTEDFCRTNEDLFIRTILEIPIIGHEEPFTWGVWVSQSKENFKYYLEHFKDDLRKRQSFGWFANVLPYYDNTLNLETTVLFQSDDKRPKLHLHECSHELANDFHNGISMEKAIKIATITQH